MKARIPSKAIIPLSVAGTLVVLAVVLAYLSYAGRPARSLSQPRPLGGQMLPRQTPRGGGPILPPASVTGQVAPGQEGVPRTPATAGLPGARPQRQAPVGGGSSAGRTPPASMMSPVARPGLPMPPVTDRSGRAAVTPASSGSDQVSNADVAIVGAGPRGRGDPFSPLAVPESARPTPVATLPPPPGVGVSMPPGFAAPGSSAAPPPPPPPGSGMRVAGIMGSRSRVAIIEAEGKTYIVGVGERVGGAVVVSIQPDKVVMKQNRVTFELGFGGERSS